MRGGRLHSVILHKLSERPHSGYSLCKEIGEITGHKPSFGSIYPILEHLAAEGMVTVRQDGRRKMYTLTPKGQSEAKHLKEHFETHMQAVVKEMQLYCEVTGLEHGPLIEIFKRIQSGENPLGPAAPRAILLRDAIFKAALEGRAKRNMKEFTKILDDARMKLERLK